MNATQERDALLAAILADPADDLSRLAYADWLEEYGSEADRLRAEFVRTQIELAKLLATPCSVEAGTWRRGFFSGGAVVTAWRNSPPARCCMPLNDDCDPPLGLCLKCERVDRLLPRERELFSRLCALLYAETPLGTRCVLSIGLDADSSLPVLRFRRGFVGEVRAPLAALLEHGKALRAAHPLTRMTATDRSPCRSTARFNGGKELWIWFGARPEGASSHVGPDVFRRLDGCAVEAEFQRAYACREAALDALSDALLSLTRPTA